LPFKFQIACLDILDLIVRPNVDVTETTPKGTVTRLPDNALAVRAGRALHVTLMLTNVSMPPSVVACPTVAATILLGRMNAAASDCSFSKMADALQVSVGVVFSKIYHTNV